MSWNILAGVRNENGEVIPMILTRASRGITHSAYLAIGEKISFSGITGTVVNIIHRHAPPMVDIAPNSEAIVAFDRRLNEAEIQTLMDHGFKFQST